MRSRFSPFQLVLAVLAVSLGFAGAAAAAGTTTGGDSPPPVTPTSPTVAVDKVLVKLNALEDQLDVMTAKLDATTAKLDATTAKLDALTLKTKDIYDTVHYSKGYLTAAIPSLQEQLRRTCTVVEDGRRYAANAAYGSGPHAYLGYCP